MSVASGISEVAGLARAIARELPKFAESVGSASEAEASAARLSLQATDLGMAGLKSSGSSITTDGHGAQNLGAVGIDDNCSYLSKMIVLNDDVSRLPAQVHRIAVDALGHYARDLAAPLAKSPIEADVLAHHIGARLRPDEVQQILRTVVDHGGVNEARPAIQRTAVANLAKMSSADTVSSRSADNSVLDFTAARVAQIFKNAEIGPAHFAAVTNKAVMELPGGEQRVAALGLLEWSESVAHELAGNSTSANAIATQLAVRADGVDVTKISSTMKAAPTVKRGLDDVAFMARHDHDHDMFSFNLDDRFHAARGRVSSGD